MSGIIALSATVAFWSLILTFEMRKELKTVMVKRIIPKARTFKKRVIRFAHAIFL
jgi:hypothetical protein